MDNHVRLGVKYLLSSQDTSLLSIEECRELNKLLSQRLRSEFYEVVILEQQRHVRYETFPSYDWQYGYYNDNRNGYRTQWNSTLTFREVKKRTVASSMIKVSQPQIDNIRCQVDLYRASLNVDGTIELEHIERKTPPQLGQVYVAVLSNPERDPDRPAPASWLGRMRSAVRKHSTIIASKLEKEEDPTNEQEESVAAQEDGSASSVTTTGPVGTSTELTV
jgi:hypothetical protein